MDPQRTAVYAQAQRDLRDLFHEIAHHGLVTASELRDSLLPLTAGDARSDLQALIQDVAQKRRALDESEFVRVLWKRMYLNNVTFAMRQSAAAMDHHRRGSSYERDALSSEGAVDDDPETAPTANHATAAASLTAAVPEMMVNIPFAHVIVSFKRRAQLKQFAQYYAGRGISGAAHLSLSCETEAAHHKRNTPPSRYARQSRRPAVSPSDQGQAPTTMSVKELRERASRNWEVVACVYDSVAMVMTSTTLFTGLASAELAPCSRLHCLLFSKDVGNLVLSNSHFLDRVRAEKRRHDGDTSKTFTASKASGDDGGGEEEDRQPEEYRDGDHDKEATEDDASLPARELPRITGQPADLTIHRLDELGVRHALALGVGRGVLCVATERRLHTWHAFPPPTEQQGTGADTDADAAAAAFLEDEGDSFGLAGGMPLLQRAKTVTDLTGVKQIACGDGFAVAVSSARGDVYAWGAVTHASNPLSAQTLTPTPTPTPTPIPIQLPVPMTSSAQGSAVVVQHVACGLHHVLALTASGVVLAWGSNVHGQLGLAAKSSCCALQPQVTTPTPLPWGSYGNSSRSTRNGGGGGGSSPVVVALDIACGDHHSLVLTDRGVVFAFGNNWHGQLGLDPNTTETGCIPEPMRVDWWGGSADGCTSSRAATSLSGSSAMSPTKKAAVAAVVASRFSSALPRAYLITAMGDTSAIVTERGQVYTWGMCIGTDRGASACGIVAHWRPQRITPLEESTLMERMTANGDGGSPLEDASDEGDGNTDEGEVDLSSLKPPALAPWGSIAIADGLVVLTRHPTANERLDHAKETTAVNRRGSATKASPSGTNDDGRGERARSTSSSNGHRIRRANR